MAVTGVSRKKGCRRPSMSNESRIVGSIFVKTSPKKQRRAPTERTSHVARAVITFPRNACLFHDKSRRVRVCSPRSLARLLARYEVQEMEIAIGGRSSRRLFDCPSVTARRRLTKKRFSEAFSRARPLPICPNPFPCRELYYSWDKVGLRLTSYPPSRSRASLCLSRCQTVYLFHAFTAREAMAGCQKVGG